MLSSWVALPFCVSTMLTLAHRPTFVYNFWSQGNVFSRSLRAIAGFANIFFCFSIYLPSTIRSYAVHRGFSFHCIVSPNFLCSCWLFFGCDPPNLSLFCMCVDVNSREDPVSYFHRYIRGYILLWLIQLLKIHPMSSNQIWIWPFPSVLLAR